MNKAEQSNAAWPARFRDYVGALPHQWILDHLTGDGGARRIVSSAMIKDAVTNFTGKAALAERFGGLPPDMRLKCAQTYLMGGNGLFVDDPASYADDPLLRSLLVFAAQSGPGLNDVRLFGFEEFMPALRTAIAETLVEDGDGRQASPAMPQGICPWRPLNDVVALCALAMHGLLKRSSHGGLARSALGALKKLAHDPTLTGKSVSEGLPGFPAGFLMGFCLNEGLIADGDSEYYLNRPAFTAWLETGMKERLRKMVSYFAAFSGGIDIGLMQEILTRAGGRKHLLGALAPESDRPFISRALSVFEFFGRIDLRYDDIDEVCANEQRRETLIMSDFNVVIPQEAPPTELFDFAKIGLLTAFDKVYKGRITKESVSNALSAGVDPAYIRLWLRDRSAAANVVKTVDEWIREFSRLFVSGGPVLVSSEEKVTRQIAAFEPFRKHLTEVSAHAVFMICPGSEQKVFDILCKLGFDTRPPGDERSEFWGVSSVDDDGIDVNVNTAPPRARWEPLTDFSSAPAPLPVAPMSRTKYGSGLKPLEINEMIHVIDYAILTNQGLAIDYEGSVYVKQGVYTVTPTGVDKGPDAAVEAEIQGLRGRKLFFLNKINRIGVVSL